MYEYLVGKLMHIAPTYLVLEVNQIGYRVLAPNPFKYASKKDQEIKIYVEQVVREDAHTLYGFNDQEEKALFLTLNKVSGIGPKSALSILAADDHQGLVQAIESGDSNYLTKFPGVGKKTAQQIILDLKGKLGDLLDHSESSPTAADTMVAGTNTQLMTEVTEALAGLGYSQREIKRIEKPLAQAQCQTTQEALSLAFKLLLNK